MNLLILGGTVFLGRHLVEAAVREGHRITLFNRGQHVTPWTELPLWVPQQSPLASLVSSVDSGRAIAAGLAYRPLPATIGATLDWAATRPADTPWRAGLGAEREQELLAAWRESSAAGQPPTPEEPR